MVCPFLDNLDFLEVGVFVEGYREGKGGIVITYAGKIAFALLIFSELVKKTLPFISSAIKGK